MVLRKLGCEDLRLMVPYLAALLAVLALQVLLPVCYVVAS
jgi:hypothetical protein